MPSSSSLPGVLNHAGADAGVGEPETFLGTHLKGQKLEGWGPRGKWIRGHPGGPVVKNLLFNTGDAGLIPGWGTKICMLHGAVEKKNQGSSIGQRAMSQKWGQSVLQGCPSRSGNI